MTEMLSSTRSDVNALDSRMSQIHSMIQKTLLALPESAGLHQEKLDKITTAQRDLLESVASIEARIDSMKSGEKHDEKGLQDSNVFWALEELRRVEKMLFDMGFDASWVGRDFEGESFFDFETDLQRLEVYVRQEKMHRQTQKEP